MYKYIYHVSMYILHTYMLCIHVYMHLCAYTHLRASTYICVYIYIYVSVSVYIFLIMYTYPPTFAGAAPRSSVHVCSPLSTTRPLPFLQIAIGPRLPHPFYCSGISPPPPGSRRSHSAVLGTTSRPRLLDPFHLSGISMVVELLGTPRHSSAPRHHKPSILVVLQW